MSHSIAVVGVGNMAKAIISGISASSLDISKISLFDKNPDQYSSLLNSIDNKKFLIESTSDICNAIEESDIVLLSVKPQNYPEVLKEINALPLHAEKLYISIGAGISSQSVSDALSGASVIRVLPNLPMLIGKGVSVVCKNDNVESEKFNLVCDIFRSAGSIVLIDEKDMNAYIGVTSSSPAYVFKFINAIYQGAISQGLSDNGNLLNVICDVLIGSAEILKSSACSAEEMISKVASKGGTTEKALASLDENEFDNIIAKAMIACTQRADELGKNK